MSRPRPLADVRVLAVEQFGAGPFGSLQLAELGAEVIKIEDPATGGDVSRTVPPYATGDGDSLFFEAFNHGKSSIALDLATPAGRAVFEDLVAVSDVVCSNLRGDVPAKLGLTYADLAPINPRIVCCSLSAFGMTGPRVTEPGYDYILQGLCGWMDLTGEPDGPPAKTGLSLVDYAGGLVAAIAILAAVHAARRDGTGVDCDLSLFDTAMSLLTYPATWHLSAGFEPTRTLHSAHPSIIPFQNLPTADGWIVVACAKEKFFARFAEVVGHPEWLDDPRFATAAARQAHRDEVVAAIEAASRTQPSSVWLERFAAAGVPAGPVNTVAEALADPHTEARGLVVGYDHPTLGAVRHVAGPVRVGDDRPEATPAPALGADRDRIAIDVLGYDRRRIDDLAEAGAFGPPGTT